MAAGLGVGLGEVDSDRVFRRSFSALILGECIARDTIQPAGAGRQGAGVGRPDRHLVPGRAATCAASCRARAGRTRSPTAPTPSAYSAGSPHVGDRRAHRAPRRDRRAGDAARRPGLHLTASRTGSRWRRCRCCAATGCRSTSSSPGSSGSASTPPAGRAAATSTPTCTAATPRPSCARSTSSSALAPEAARGARRPAAARRRRPQGHPPPLPRSTAARPLSNLAGMTIHRRPRRRARRRRGPRPRRRDHVHALGRPRVPDVRRRGEGRPADAAARRTPRADRGVRRRGDRQAHPGARAWPCSPPGRA